MLYIFMSCDVHCSVIDSASFAFVNILIMAILRMGFILRSFHVISADHCRIWCKCGKCAKL